MSMKNHIQLANCCGKDTVNDPMKCLEICPVNANQPYMTFFLRFFDSLPTHTV